MRVKPSAVDRGHRRPDAPDQVGPAGGGVLVGRGEEGLHGEVDDGLPSEGLRLVADLHDGAGVEAVLPISRTLTASPRWMRGSLVSSK